MRTHCLRLSACGGVLLAAVEVLADFPSGPTEFNRPEGPGKRCQALFAGTALKGASHKKYLTPFSLIPIPSTETNERPGPQISLISLPADFRPCGGLRQ